MIIKNKSIEDIKKKGINQIKITKNNAIRHNEKGKQRININKERKNYIESITSNRKFISTPNKDQNYCSSY
jgi:hypothetical protein